MPAINTLLWDKVQAHIDNHYAPTRAGDGIDWTGARQAAHEDLDPIYGREAVDHAVDTYRQ